jgi:hypothetical protein
MRGTQVSVRAIPTPFVPIIPKINGGDQACDPLGEEAIERWIVCLNMKVVQTKQTEQETV